MSDESLAEKVHGDTPWWAKALEGGSRASILLAAGIVGVPSLIALLAGAFIAHTISGTLNQLTTYNQSEIYLLNEQINQTKHDMSVVMKYVQDELKAQYETCIHAAKNDRERSDCLSPAERQERYGIKRNPNTVH